MERTERAPFTVRREPIRNCSDEAAATGPHNNIPRPLNITSNTTRASFGLIQPNPSFTEDPSTSAAATSLRFH